MRSPHLRFLAFDARGLSVSARHECATAPVDPRLNTRFELARPEVLARVLARPGGFDGERACLVGWSQDGGHLSLQTRFRTYTQGLALKQVLKGARETDALLETRLGEPQPLPGASWGMSLVCVVLLPEDRVLAGQRSPNMLVSPGAWSCGFTEVLEPADTAHADLAQVARRLVSEELPALAALPAPRIVGLGVRDDTYTWQLAALLDARALGAEALEAVSRLQPDAETSAFEALPLHTNRTDLLDIELARELARRT